MRQLEKFEASVFATSSTTMTAFLEVLLMVLIAAVSLSTLSLGMCYLDHHGVSIRYVYWHCQFDHKAHE